jgi:hypothetical protein
MNDERASWYSWISSAIAYDGGMTKNFIDFVKLVNEAQTKQVKYSI